MGSFKNEILHALKKSNSTNEILDKISNYQNILMKNYNNQILSKEMKNKILDIHTELQNLGKAIYKHGLLKQHNIINEEDNEDLEGVVLKGGISNVRYVWHSEQGEHTCDECAELDGQEFDMFDDIPEKPHPNCQCTIEMIEDNSEEGEPCDCLEQLEEWLQMCVDACLEVETMQMDNEETKESLENIIDRVTNTDLSMFKFYINEARAMVLETIDVLTDILYQIIKSIEIFAENYGELVQLKEDVGHYVDWSAEYYHAKANCEATQLGNVGEQTASILGLLREFFDFPKELLFKGQSIEQALNNSLHDLEVNEEGRKYGKENLNKDCRVILRDKIKVNLPQNK